MHGKRLDVIIMMPSPALQMPSVTVEAPSRALALLRQLQVVLATAVAPVAPARSQR